MKPLAFSLFTIALIGSVQLAVAQPPEPNAPQAAPKKQVKPRTTVTGKVTVNGVPQNANVTKTLTVNGEKVELPGDNAAATKVVVDGDEVEPVADALPAFHVPLNLTGAFAADGQNAPNEGNIIEPLGNSRPLKIAIYDGPGAPDKSQESIRVRALMIPGTTVTLLKPAEFETTDLSKFDIVAFSGGMSSTQGTSLGVKGRDKVREYVWNGGSYLGICAGAYLACSNYSWSLGILNARTISPQWKRGAAFLQVEMAEDGKKIFGPTQDKFFVRYHNGPIIEPANRPELPPYKVDVYFRNEVALFKAPVGIQVNSPAVVSATYGQGKVLTISPHPENTKGLENFLPRGLAWLGEKAKG